MITLNDNNIVLRNKLLRDFEFVLVIQISSTANIFSEILDNILIHINDCFKSIENHQFLSVLNCNLFEIYSKHFPNSDLEKYFLA